MTINNRQEKIDKIYEKIADKTLSFGCAILVKNINFEPLVEEIYCYHLGNDVFLTESGLEYDNKDIKEIIGHKVMIGHVLYYWDKNYNLWNNRFEEIIRLWFDKTKPLEHQDDDCIDCVFDILLN